MNKLWLCLLLIIVFGSLRGEDNIYFNAERALSYLDIPSPYSLDETDEVVHPDVIYVPEGWNGYKYWMAFTPFPTSTPVFENPCIVVSQNGENWSVPDGLTNPVVAPYDNSYNPSNYYHSDTELILSPDKATMYLLWRDKFNWNGEKIFVKTSTDGINWSGQIELLYSITSNGGEKLISPTVIYNGTNYEMFTVNTGSSPRTYYRRTASSPTGPWGDKTQVSVPLYDGASWMPPAVYTGQLSSASMVWHWNILYENNEYWMIGAVGGATDTQSFSLWIAKSTDGLSWTFDNNPLLDAAVSGWDKYLYRAAAIPYYLNDVMNLKLWYSSNGGTAVDGLQWHIGYTEAFSPDYAILSIELSGFLAVVGSYNKVNLHWATASERNVLGFNLLRGEDNNPEAAEKINSEIIGAENSNTGANYHYSDNNPPETEVIFYWLEMISIEGISEMYGPVRVQMNTSEEATPDPTSGYGLLGAYPNPFNPTTEIAFNLLKAGKVRIQIFDLRGRLIWEYSSSNLKAGKHEVLFDSDKQDVKISSGVYFCKYTDELSSQFSKLVLLK